MEEQQQQQQYQPTMSLNVHLTVPPATTSGADGSHTPNTPEILNSLVNMTTGPFTGYDSSSTNPDKIEGSVPLLDPSVQLNSPTSDSNTDFTSLSSPSSSSPASTPGSTAVMSVSQYRSQFIKEGLKMKVKQKLGVTGNPSVSTSPTSVPTIMTTPAAVQEPRLQQQQQQQQPKPTKVVVKSESLTHEDENRRWRRRERNKIAATKCRNKKKMKTAILIKESETLTTQNQNLKSEIARLEAEKAKLMEVLSAHTSGECLKQKNSPPSNEFRVPVPPDQQPPPGLAALQQKYAAATAAATAAAAVAEVPTSLPSPSLTSLEDTPPPPSFLRSCSFTDNQYQHYSNNFLAKSTLCAPYLDMDSRCIAL